MNVFFTYSPAVKQCNDALDHFCAYACFYHFDSSNSLLVTFCHDSSLGPRRNMANEESHPNLLAFIKHFIGDEQLTYISENIEIGTKGPYHKEQRYQTMTLLYFCPTIPLGLK